MEICLAARVPQTASLVLGSTMGRARFITSEMERMQATAMKEGIICLKVLPNCSPMPNLMPMKGKAMRPAMSMTVPGVWSQAKV